MELIITSPLHQYLT